MARSSWRLFEMKRLNPVQSRIYSTSACLENICNIWPKSWKQLRTLEMYCVKSNPYHPEITTNVIQWLFFLFWITNNDQYDALTNKTVFVMRMKAFIPFSKTAICCHYCSLWKKNIDFNNKSGSILQFQKANYDLSHKVSLPSITSQNRQMSM